MREIVLVRHAESTSNIGEHLPHLHGDHHLALTDEGFDQAQLLAHEVDKTLLETGMVYCSPFARARLTLATVMDTLGIEQPVIRESVLLREQDRGYVSEDAQHEQRKIHGWFWYRYIGGESPADVYQRVSLFIDALYRESHRSGREEAFIMCHGMTIRCFVMRFLNLSVEDFERMANPKNCDIVRLARAECIGTPAFSNERWAVEGIRLR